MIQDLLNRLQILQKVLCMEAESFHRPVLLIETLKYLITDKSGVYFDGTLGGGGFSEAILEKLDSNGRVIASDLDINAIDYCRQIFKNESRIKIVNDNFKNIKSILNELRVTKINGAVLDLGVSSFQLNDAAAGFSYRFDSDFDLRFNKSTGISASDVINNSTQKEIEHILKDFGEEKNYKRIAKKILERRSKSKISNSSQVVELIKEIVPQRFVNETLSRVFQAFRICVNEELENLKKFLNEVIDLIISNGRIIIISYHSLEDRIVKDFINYEALTCVCPKDFPICRCNKIARLKKLHSKVITPSEDEIRLNPRGRSAKLRAAEVL